MQKRVKKQVKFNSLSNRKKNAIIAKALNSSSGRAALAQAMVAPIRNALSYASVARKMFMVDELPDGAMGYYEGIANGNNDYICFTLVDSYDE